MKKNNNCSLLLKNPLFRFFAYWGCLVGIFVLARVYYLMDYWNVLIQQEYLPLDLLKALFSALRFDSSMAAAISSPLFILSFIQLLKGNSNSLFVRLSRYYMNIASPLAVLVLIVDHFYFLYFSDHFNFFFWEFWEDTNNADLVLSGIFDVIPVTSLFTSGLFLFLLFVFSKAYFALLAKLGGQGFAFASNTPKSVTKRMGLAMLFCLFFFFLLRSTFDTRPLMIQDRRLSISSNKFINLLHTNPFFPLIRGYKEWKEAGNSLTLDFNEEAALNYFQKVADLNKSGRIQQERDKITLVQEIAPLSQNILTKKPKHIVLFFMESLSSWVLDYPDLDFQRKIAESFYPLREKGISFERHFPAGAGTLKNIVQTILGFPIGKDFPSSINYHKEGYKKYKGSLARLMKQLGYDPTFFYAGHHSWHRLYQYIPTLGFSEFYAEHSFPDIKRHRWGTYDGDLFREVHDYLDNKSEASTFTFVMSQSNHPPYLVPKDFETYQGELPPKLKEQLTVDYDHFMKRVNAFKYSVDSLGAFMKEAQKSPYFNDTLFLITGDHAFGGGVGFSQMQGWEEERIPLLFYGPGVLQPEWQGKKMDFYTTHLDITPSVMAILSDQEMQIETFGKNIFAENDYHKDSGVNIYFSCLSGMCVKKNRLYHLDGRDFNTFSTDGEQLGSVVERVLQVEQAFYNAGHYFMYHY